MATAEVERPPETITDGLRLPNIRQAHYTQSMKPVYKYSPPNTGLDSLTTYIRDYTRKTGDRSRPIRPDGTRADPGRFEGEQTYRADYKPWDIAPRQSLSPRSNYVPPSATFEAQTNYTSDYKPYQVRPAEIRKPLATAVSSEQPLQNATEHKDNYIRHSLPPRYVREMQKWEPNTARLDDESHYRRDYTPKTLTKSQSCRPDLKPYQSEVPLANETTHREDYKPWELSARQRREYETYKKPDGEFYSNTTTGTDYTHKPLERTLAYRPTERQRTPASFDSRTNYKEEYKTWPLGDWSRVTKKQEYKAPEIPFSGEPSYRHDYVAYPGSPRTESMKPVYSKQMSDKPFDSTTGYREDYIRHSIPERYQRERETWKPNEARLDDSTNYMTDYVPKDLTKQTSCKPPARAVASDARFIDDTTHRADYITWSVERPKLHQAETYKQPEGTIDHNTTTHLDYSAKQIEKVMAIKPEASKQQSGAFDGTTNYKTDFVLHQVEARKPKEKAEYVPSDIKFEGLPTYRRDYVSYGESPRQPSMKPAQAASSSNVPLSDLTEYKDQYLGFEMEPCPSWKIQSGSHSGYRFVDEDKNGHQYFETKPDEVAAA